MATIYNEPWRQVSLYWINCRYVLCHLIWYGQPTRRRAIDARILLRCYFVSSFKWPRPVPFPGMASASEIIHEESWRIRKNDGNRRLWWRVPKPHNVLICMYVCAVIVPIQSPSTPLWKLSFLYRAQAMSRLPCKERLGSCPAFPSQFAPFASSSSPLYALAKTNTRNLRLLFGPDSKTQDSIYLGVNVLHQNGRSCTTTPPPPPTPRTRMLGTFASSVSVFFLVESYL